jgi:hypothetical protein
MTQQSNHMPTNAVTPLSIKPKSKRKKQVQNSINSSYIKWATRKRAYFENQKNTSILFVTLNLLGLSGIFCAFFIEKLANVYGVHKNLDFRPP